MKEISSNCVLRPHQDLVQSLLLRLLVVTSPPGQAWRNWLTAPWHISDGQGKPPGGDTLSETQNSLKDTLGKIYGGGCMLWLQISSPTPSPMWPGGTGLAATLGVDLWSGKGKPGPQEKGPLDRSSVRSCPFPAAGGLPGHLTFFQGIGLISLLEDGIPVRSRHMKDLLLCK